MVQERYFNPREREATEAEFQSVAFTAISILGSLVIAIVLLTLYVVI